MPRATILLVDDQESFLTGLTELLRAQGLDVVPCGDFPSAREYLIQHTPDVLVSDIRLRQYNGLHLVVLARARVPNLVAFVYSSHRDPTIEAEATQCGAVFLDKHRVGVDLVVHLADLQLAPVAVTSSDRPRHDPELAS